MNTQSKNTARTYIRSRLLYCPKKIVYQNRVYEFYTPLMCDFKKESDHYSITCEMLHLFAVGKTKKATIEDFNEEFDFIYRRYNELPDKQLGEHLIRIKKILNLIVKK
jgi:hypothetical protein